MATFKITDPSTGRILKVTGDSPPTQQEMEQLFSQFKVETVDPIEQQRQQLAEQLASEQGPFQSAAIAAGRGLTTIARGLGLAEPEDPATTRAFKALQEQRPISTTIGEVAGEAAPFLLPGGLVAKAATIPGRVAAAGLLGAAEGSLIVSGKGGGDIETLKGAGIGGAVAGTLELALPIIGRIGGKIFRNVTGKTPSTPLLDKQGQPSQEFVAALDKAGLSFDDVAGEANRLIDVGEIDDAVSLARRSFLEEQGITPTLPQITGEATQFQAQQELAKTSGKVRRALAGQETILAKRFENAVTATGGSANRSTSPTIDFIADRSIDLDKSISDAYKAARESAPTEKKIQLDKLSSALNSLKDFERSTGGLPSAVKGFLKQRGLVDSSGRLITTNKKAISDIAKLKSKAKRQGLSIDDSGVVRNSLGQVSERITSELSDLNAKNVGRLLNATEAESLRIDLNSLFDTLKPLGKRRLAGLKDALDSDVENAFNIDAFSRARAAKAKFESDLSRAKINKFDSRKKNLVRDILENKINPDEFLKEAVLSKTTRSADLEQLKRFLHLDFAGVADAGPQAWNDLRAEAMEHIKNTAIREVAGEPALTRAGIERALGQFGRDKLRVLFSREERKFLNDMLKTSKLREPVRGTALGKGPSAQAISGLSKAVNRIPLINSVFGGATELVASDVSGRLILRQPPVTPLRPSKLTELSPAAIPAILPTQQEDQQ